MRQIITIIVAIVAIIMGAAFALSISRPAKSEEQPTPSEYTLKVTAADIALLGQAIDELPARIGRPLAQRLITQVQVQNAEFAKKNPALDKTPAKR